MEMKAIKNGIVSYENSLNRIKKEFCEYKIGNVTLIISNKDIISKITKCENVFDFKNISKFKYNIEVQKTSVHENTNLKSSGANNCKKYICNLNMSIRGVLEYLEGDKINILNFSERFSDYLEVNKKSVGIKVIPLILVIYVDNFNKMLMNLQYTIKLE